MFGLVILASSSPLYGKVPRLVLQKRNRLTHAVILFQRHFPCGALLLFNCSSAEREGLSTHIYNGNIQQNLYAQHPLSLRIFTALPVLAYDFLSQCKFSTLTSTLLYNSRPCAQNPVFEIVHEEGVKICTKHPVSWVFPSLPGSRLVVVVLLLSSH